MYSLTNFNLLSDAILFKKFANNSFGLSSTKKKIDAYLQFVLFSYQIQILVVYNLILEIQIIFFHNLLHDDLYLRGVCNL